MTNLASQAALCYNSRNIVRPDDTRIPSGQKHNLSRLIQRSCYEYDSTLILQLLQLFSCFPLDEWRKVIMPRKGQHQSEDAKKRISQSLMHHTVSPETRIKLQAQSTGKEQTAETKAKKLAGHQQWLENATPEQRATLGSGKRGKKDSEETCRKRSETLKSMGLVPPTKGKVYSEEEKSIKYATRIGKPAHNKGKPMPEHVKEMLFSPEIKAKRAASYSANFDALSPEEQQKRLAPWIDGSHLPGKQSNTAIEQYVASQLDAHGLTYETQKRIGRYSVDFFFSEQNLIIEVNGCFWHSCEECGYGENPYRDRREHDKKRIAFLESRGYTVAILWEHDLRPFMEGT